MRMETVTTEEKIRKAALREFSLYGFEGARVDRIAQKAKVNKAMIYYHYKGKEALYESLLAEVYTTVVPRITGNIPEDMDPAEALERIVIAFVDYIRDLDQDFVKMMLRELSSGGKYFKKLLLPNVIIPMIKIIDDLMTDGIQKGVFKPIVPHYTFIQTIGSIVFTNAIRITLSDTEVGKFIFKEDFFEGFKKNLMTVIKTGILA